MTRPDLFLLRRWVVARARLTLRTPRAVFFTFAFPLMFLVLFTGLNGNANVAAAGSAGGEVPFAQFYTPSIGIFGLTTACYTAVIFGLAQRPRHRAAQARPRDAAADAVLPRRVARRAPRSPGSPASC